MPIGSSPSRITEADVIGRRGKAIAHLKFQGGAGWMYELEGLPRMKLLQQTIRGHASRIWYVDDKPFDELDAAIAAYNGEPMEKRKFSLAQQIEEIDRELAQRRDVYPRLVSSGKLRQSVADYQVGRLESARATLVWLQEHELTIKQRLAS